VLATMRDAQFLTRNEKHKTYSLGVAPIAIGQAAIEKHRGIEIARREMANLARELRVQCSVTGLVDDELLILVREGTPQADEGFSRVGERRQYLLAAFSLVRERGYALVASGPAMRALRRARAQPPGQVRSDAALRSVHQLVGRLSAPELQMADARDAGAEGVSYIAAPVFSPNRTVSFQVVITGMPTNLDARSIKHFAERLCATAAIITNETHSWRPGE
jgi:DNA-binding IclR family transcriptional regulator